MGSEARALRVGTLLVRAAAAPVAVALVVVLAPAGLAAVHVTDGLYAPKASTATPYSNGAVDLVVTGSGRTVAARSGVACYTGATPPAGVPSNDEVTIHVPRALTISARGAFAFSGPVTLTPQDAQSAQAIKTTFTLRGSFVAGKNGKPLASGTVSSPICQSSTPKHFASPFVGAAG